MTSSPWPTRSFHGSPHPHNVFTVDLEDWFHVCGVERYGPSAWTSLPSRVEPTTRWLLDTLDSAGVRATFFVVGWIAERMPHLVELVLEAGHEIGSHGHLHQRAYDLGRDGFRRDLRESIRALRAAGAQEITLFRAPEWSINDRSLWALEVLVEEGFRLDASMAPVALVGSRQYPRHPHIRQTTSGPIVEVPPLVRDRVGQVMPFGWGWGLRMSAPRTVLAEIERMNRAGHGAVLTVHPWEIDPDPPRVRLPARQHFAHYFCLSGFADRLCSILRAARFGPIGPLSSAVSVAG